MIMIKLTCQDLKIKIFWRNFPDVYINLYLRAPWTFTTCIDFYTWWQHEDIEICVKGLTMRRQLCDKNILINRIYIKYKKYFMLNSKYINIINFHFAGNWGPTQCRITVGKLRMTDGIAGCTLGVTHGEHIRGFKKYGELPGMSIYWSFFYANLSFSEDAVNKILSASTVR